VKNKDLVVAAATFVLGAWQAAAAAEPAIGFDYFANNWNVVGLKDYTHGSRITPANELWLSGKTAIQIRVGRNLTPLSRNNGKFAQDGWMPIILVRADDGPVRYDIAFWATPLPDAKNWQKAFDWPTEGENYLNWISVKATNTLKEPAEARVDIRPNLNLKNVKHPEEQAEQKSGGTHTRTHAWSWMLGPGQSAEGVARYPFFPVGNPAACDEADSKLWRERTAEYWRGVMQRAAHIQTPCRKATEALLAAHVCQLIANDHGEVHGGEGFYDTFYIRDGAYQVMELEEAGFFDTAAKAVELYLKRQRPDGRFESQKNQFDANGQAVWTLWQYYKLTADKKFLQRVYPQMRRAVEWTIRGCRQAPADSPFAGLLPTAPADGEFLWDGKHHIVGYDLWNLRGMLCTVDAARVLGKRDEAEELAREAKSYRSAIDAASKRTGLAHFPPSWEKAGTHWGDTETLWPTELFDRGDPRVAALNRHVRKEFAGGFIEGTIQWKGKGDVEAIHPYMGAYTTMSDLVRGDDAQVVEDFYWYLLHSTAAHAFPEGIFYKQRKAWSDTIPHVTGACNYAIMLRHMLVHEENDELHLLKAVPDWWLEAGQEIRVERLPTWFGQTGFAVRGTKVGVELTFDPPKREPPKKVVIHLPESRPLRKTPKGVTAAFRPNQKTRWDFDRVVALYRPQMPPPPKPIPGLVTLPLFEKLSAARCEQFDLSKVANTDPFTAPFGTKKPGKFLFTSLEPGIQEVGGVPFRILDPAQNGGRGLVVLEGANTSSKFPREVIVPVGQQGTRLFFLGNVHGWRSGGEGVGEWGAVAEYVIHYADGQTQTVPIITGRTADEWAAPPSASEVFVGLRGDPWHLNVLGVALRPVRVERIIFRDLGTPVSPVLAAVTLER
jgi:hypothetical protein